MSSPTRAVVTALLGGYESLTEQPTAHDSEVAFLCFSEDPAVRSTTWTVRPVEPIFPGDMVRSARDVKLRIHRYLPDVDEVLWIDNSVVLTTAPEVLLDEWLAEADVVIPRHSYRGPVVEEFAAVAADGLDDLTRIYEQYAHYRVAYPEALEAQTLWTGMMVRRLGAPGVRQFGERWMEHVLRYSRRDQLSVIAALGIAGPRLATPDWDNFASFAHSWPVSSQRRNSVRLRALDFIPKDVAAAQAREAEERSAAEIAELRARLVDAAAERADLVAEIAALTAENGPLAAAKQELDSVLASRSFRLTATPRRLAASARTFLGRPPR